MITTVNSQEAATTRGHTMIQQLSMFVIDTRTFNMGMATDTLSSRFHNSGRR